jgi:hypothetical protein
MATFELCEDFDEPDAPDPDGADVLWARQVLGRAIRRMRRECRHGGKTKMRVWCVFEARFLRPFRGQPELSYPELVARYGYSAPKIAQNDAGDGKRMLAEALLSVVSEYAGGDDARSELNDLWQIVRQAGLRANRGRTHETDHPDKGVDRDQPEHEDSRQPDA